LLPTCHESNANANANTDGAELKSDMLRPGEIEPRTICLDLAVVDELAVIVHSDIQRVTDRQD
jgi:hypothetical protein